MRRSGLAPYFEEMFISDTLGVRKPEKGFFDIVFSRISGFEPQRALLIGDSLSSDMAGGENAGIDTCWYNPGRIANDRGAAVTMQAASYEEIRSILLP